MTRRLSHLAGLLVLLLGSAALAETPPEAADPPESAMESEEAAPPSRPAPARTKVPFRVVKILSDSEQALLFDKHRGRHVLVEVGEEIGDYTVDAIGEDEVTLTGSAAQIIVLAAPERPRRAGKDRSVKAAASKLTADVVLEPQDPYGEPVVSETPDDVRSVSVAGFEGEDPYDTAPAAPPAPTTASTAALVSPNPTPAAPTTVPTIPALPPAASPSTGPTTSASWDGAPAAPTTTPAPAPAITPAPAAAPTGPLTIKLARTDVATALADFGALAGSLSATFTPGGLRLDAVTEGTIFTRAGLLTGDLIVSVDGKPLRSLDDAADLYARASTTKVATLAVLRAGKPLVLRVAIQ